MKRLRICLLASLLATAAYADPTETTEAPAPAFDPCTSPNAQDAWHRLADQYRLSLLVRSFYFAGSDGRTLLIRQARKKGGISGTYVQIAANWYDRTSSLETQPKELNNEERFLNLKEVRKLAGPAWLGGVSNSDRPLLEEEVFALNADSEDETVTQNNGVATALRMTWKKQLLVCGKNAGCHCEEKKVSQPGNKS
ncbi:MAG: hypothetical protein JST16_07065 [Bdellovibrionales bacterium]|nr:hypothetical protein [Bdellovibrionales bacterium]